MADQPDVRVHEVIAGLQELLAPPEGGGEAPRRPLPEDWHTDPIKRLIAMVLADPTPAGVAIALAFFYGRGLPDPDAPAAERVAPDAAVFDALLRCIESDGLETVRRQITEAMGEP